MTRPNITKDRLGLLGLLRLLGPLGLLGLLGCSASAPTPQQSTHLPLGVVTLNGLDAASNDVVDWHQIDVQDPGQLTIRLEFETRDAPVGRVELHDATGKQWVDAELLAFGNVWRVDVAPGQYFLKLQLEAGAMTYQVQATLEPW